MFGWQAAPPRHPATNPEHDLTRGEFFRDIGYNFAALFQKSNVLPVLAGGAAIAAATAPEQRLERHFSRGDIWGPWAEPARYIGHPIILTGASAVLFAASRSSSDVTFRSVGYSLVHGAIMTSAITQAAKPAFHRLRPSGDNHFAFPSGHATDTFMFATILADHYGWKAAVAGYAVATYVAASRLEHRKHHLTDVAAGAAIGYVVGKTVTRRMFGNEPSRFGLQVLPRGGGFSASLRIDLP
jgi:membrane-associated phospholipid phosphatase